MRDDDGAIDPVACEGRTNPFGLPLRRRRCAASQPRAPAMAPTVDAEDPESPCAQTVGERDMQVGEIARSAMDEQHGAAVDVLGLRFDDMDRAGADIHEGAVRGIAHLDSPGIRVSKQHRPGDSRRRQDRDYAYHEPKPTPRVYKVCPTSAAFSRLTASFIRP